MLLAGRFGDDLLTRFVYNVGGNVWPWPNYTQCKLNELYTSKQQITWTSSNTSECTKHSSIKQELQ